MSLPRAKIKKQLIEEAKSNHLVSYLCHKSGIARATFYRWVEDDKKFAREIKNAQKLGRHAICDLAESKIMQLVKSPNENVSLNASKYILNNNHKNYIESNWGYGRIKLEKKIQDIKKHKDDEITTAIEEIQNLIKLGRIDLDEEVERRIKLKENESQHVV